MYRFACSTFLLLSFFGALGACEPFLVGPPIETPEVAILRSKIEISFEVQNALVDQYPQQLLLQPFSAESVVGTERVGILCVPSEESLVQETFSQLFGCSLEPVEARAWLAPFQPAKGEVDPCLLGEVFVPTPFGSRLEGTNQFSPVPKNEPIGFINPSPTDPIDTQIAFQEETCGTEVVDFFLTFP